MNTRLIKESRELAPMLLGTLLMIIVPCLVWRAAAEAIGYVAFGLACAVLGGYAFGAEFQHRTMSLLLSQPIARSVLWREKMLVLGGALLASTAALLVCLATCARPAFTFGPVISIGVMALCAFCGGPYWTLMLRNGLAGIVAAPAVPAMILILSAYVCHQFTSDEELAIGWSTGVVVLYCCVVYWLGFRKFQRLQVIETSARELALPARWEAALTRPLARVAARFGGVFGTLVKKELRLQQVSFLLAGVYSAIAVAGFVVYVTSHDWGAGIIIGDHLFFMIILPLVAGAVAIGEERSWGLAEWHATLPPSARTQWNAKMLVTLLTSVTLGLLLPGLLFLAGTALLGEFPRGLSSPTVTTICGWVFAQLLVTSTAVYAATFSRSSLWAILSAFLILCASGVFVWWTGFWVDAVPPVSLALVGHLKQVAMGIVQLFPSLLLLLLWVLLHFAWRNFRRHGASPLGVLFQVIAILLSAGLLSGLGFLALCVSQAR